MEKQYYRIKDIASIKSGKRLPAGHLFSDEPTSHPYIRSRDIKNGRILSSNLAYLEEETFQFIKKYIIEEGDVAITIVANIGDIGYCDTDCDKFNLTENAVRLTKFNQKIVDSQYLAFYMGQPFMKQYMESLAAGAAQAKLGIYKIEKIKVPLPKIEYQRRIASILSAYDNLIENNNRRIRLLEQMAENLYKEWFVRFRFPGHEKVEMENGLPKGWKRTELSNEYKTSSGGTPSRTIPEYYENGKIPWIKTGELQDSILTDTEEYITENAVKHSSAKLFPKGTLLMAMYGVNIGKLAISNINATCNQACCVLVPRRIDSKYFLFYYLKSIRDYLLSIGFGAAQQNLSQELIKSLKIIIPNDTITIAFEHKVDGFYQQIGNLKSQNNLLSRQRDLLLPRLMSGKLEVNA